MNEDKQMTSEQEAAFWEGRAAARNGIAVSGNPHGNDSDLAEWWRQGFEAHKAARAKVRAKGRAHRWNEA